MLESQSVDDFEVASGVMYDSYTTNVAAGVRQGSSFVFYGCDYDESTVLADRVQEIRKLPLPEQKALLTALRKHNKPPRMKDIKGG